MGSLTQKSQSSASHTRAPSVPTDGEGKKGARRRSVKIISFNAVHAHDGAKYGDFGMLDTAIKKPYAI